jgi:hypothetical protein
MVYAKPPFGGPKQVLKYLARYTHRVAVANARLITMEAGQVSFHWKDYAHGNEPKVMTLDAVEFIRRFLLHVLPSGFVRIRHYGFLANRHRETKIRLCRVLLGVPAAPQELAAVEPGSENVAALVPDSGPRCPVCNKGRMVIVEALAPQHLNAASVGVPPICSAHDTS